MSTEAAHADCGPRIRLLLVDDHPLFRAGVRERLAEHDPGLEVVGEAEDSWQAQQMIAALSPDVVLMDIAMPGENGLDATRAIRRMAPGVAVILLSVYDDVQYIEAAVEAGAAGYFLKTVQAPDLATAIRRAHEGDAVLSAEVAGMVFRRLRPHLRSEADPVAARRLSDREAEVLRHLAQGATNKEMARAMQLSVRTVEAHLRSIFTKLGVGSRTEAVILAIKVGVVHLDDLEGSDGRRP